MWLLNRKVYLRYYLQRQNEAQEKPKDHPSDQRRVTKLRWRKKYCARGRRLIKSSCLRHNNKIKLFVIENISDVFRVINNLHCVIISET